MKTIENRGAGNCMYYAYAISLMYYLRAESNKTKVTQLLGRFNLSAEQRQQLQHLLDHNRDRSKPFKAHDLLSIQHILGPACRALASQHVRNEYISDPRATALFAAANYQMYVELKKQLDPQYSQYIEQPLDEHGRLSDAEIFKVQGMQQAITDHAKNMAQNIQTEFNQEHAKYSSGRAKMALMDRIIHPKTIDFFNMNHYQHLDQYATHLNTVTIWGSEETLLSLNIALSGETKTRLPEDNQIIVTQETPITLGILNNGLDQSGHIRLMDDYASTDDAPYHIILNHIPQHWNSVIPETYLTDTPTCSTNDALSIDETSESKTLSTLSSPDLFFNNRSISTPEPLSSTVRLDKALEHIKNAQLLLDYKIKLLELMQKQSGITDIDAASAHIGESDEAFAERLQIAEIEHLYKKY